MNPASLPISLPAEAVNICGVVIHLAPDRESAAFEAIAALSGIEIHAHSADGRLVVTAEDAEGVLAIDQLAAINRIPGVVSATLAYHVFDEAEADPEPCTCGNSGTCTTPSAPFHS